MKCFEFAAEHVSVKCSEKHLNDNVTPLPSSTFPGPKNISRHFSFEGNKCPKRRLDDIVHPAKQFFFLCVSTGKKICFKTFSYIFHINLTFVFSG